MDSKSLRYEKDIINAFIKGEMVIINEWSSYDLNNLAEQAAELVPNCIGICYAFGSSISLVIGKENVPYYSRIKYKMGR